MDPACGAIVHVDFPEITSALLENLNQQRVEGKLCDISIHVQGRVFRAHRAVLAASSPYFHDQVLLKNMTSIVLPNVMDPGAFETVLGSAYTGKLSMASDEIVNFLTVGSVLQMWHIVDKCTELLKEGRGTTGPSPSSSFRAHSSRTSENQSPSSSNYFSPRETGEGPEHGPAKYALRGVAGGIERDGSEGPDEEVIFQAEKGPTRCPEPFSGGSKFILETDDDVSDSGGDGGGGGRRPAYVQPSIMPQKQWVYIKKERSQEDLVLTCEEDEDPVEVGPAPGEPPLSISDVRTLTEPSGAKLEEQVNFCESSEDFPSPYEGLEEGWGSGGSFAQRSLMPMDMQGNQILVFPPQTPVEHGAVQLAAGSGDGNKIFMCHCGKAFSHKSMRDRHVNMHLNLRPFDCPVCNKKFKMKHHLTEHMKTHTGLKPYECDVCAKKFMWRDSFMRHKGHCERRHRLSGAASATTPLAMLLRITPLLLLALGLWGEREKPKFCGEVTECFTFDLICNSSDYEARLYPPSAWVSTRVNNTYTAAKTIGFWHLFRYIQGRNQLGKGTPTAPLPPASDSTPTAPQPPHIPPPLEPLEDPQPCSTHMPLCVPNHTPPLPPRSPKPHSLLPWGPYRPPKLHCSR
ncbi:Zinc finger and BTB domain-containing protein 22 [Chelonia mydas]|uniref:Zinc finger and BTB domain-containing protein 22 n=1 Tax=Chelonia mydas TaxID=8469 RepID=M7B392_CHEMY|nr:Zinc finger and BTB domain-containing protein 22 [Chelonia mydas]